jgi:hypothetical protein
MRRAVPVGPTVLAGRHSPATAHAPERVAGLVEALAQMAAPVPRRARQRVPGTALDLRPRTIPIAQSAQSAEPPGKTAASREQANGVLARVHAARQARRVA